MIPINLEEIEFASKILFNGDKNKFYDNYEVKTGERIDVIKCLDNKDIVACPGSGKTTALIAKLIIISKRMPFEDGRGICVLTHTNVAIDIIKDKLGFGASKLFSYPNFFGTIQSFVDTFLAMPYCAFTRNSRITKIDNERILSESKKYYLSLKFGEDGNKTLKNALYGKATRESDWKKTNTNDKHKNAINFLSRLIVDYENDKIVYGIYGDTFRKKSSSSEQARNHYQEILEFKEQLLKEGIISYEDAYNLGKDYLKKYPEISLAFQERFKYVFIDEMQDTAEHQREIIEQLFKDNKKTIIQYYGDPNQAIFESEGQKDGGWNPGTNNSLVISNSKRFGNSIASVLNPNRVLPDDANSIKGVNKESTIKPYLLLYENIDNCTNVFQKFGEIIAKNNLHLKDNPNFVAVGRVGKEKDNGEVTIKSYFETFEKKSSKKKEFHRNLISYLRKDRQEIKSIKAYSDRIINGILHILEEESFKNEIKRLDAKEGEIISVKRFTKNTLFNFLKFKHNDKYLELKEKVVYWANQLHNDKLLYNAKIKEEIEEYIKNILALKGKNIDTSKDFYKIPKKIEDQIKTTETDGSIETKNDEYIFSKIVDGSNIGFPIRINTVHGEKGETHTATLYLDTYFKKLYDSERIKKQLIGTVYKSNKKEPEIKMAYKIAYVAMSRPQYLLCFAVQKSRVQDILDDPKEKDKLENLWKVEEV